MTFATQSEEEGVLLLRMLESALGDLRMEIGKTENFAMRQDLKHDEELLKAMIARLRQVAAPA
jgi:hypothetical protein